MAKLYDDRLNRERARIRQATVKCIQENAPNLSSEEIQKQVNKIIV